MGLFSKILGGGKRNKRLAAWGKTVSLTELQQTVMWELWQSARNETVPVKDPLAKLSVQDQEYVLKICGTSFRPVEFGSADVLRLASFRYYKDMGFTSKQCAVLVGMMFNMVGRKDL